MTDAQEIEDRLQFTIGDRMNKALHVSGVSVQTMADYLGVSRGTINNYMAERTQVRKQTLRLWAMRCGVPYEWLTTGVVPSGGGDDGQDTVNMDKPKLATVTPIRPGLLAA